MLVYCNLAVLTLVTFQGQVHSGKVIGGHVVVPHSRPYMVLLKTKNPNDPPKYCGGFLISEDFVMTAAHCQAESYEAFLGLHKYSENHKLRLSVKQVFPNKYYNESDFTNDLMLLKLSSKVKWSNTVKPIVLAEHQGSSLPDSCTVCGWGQTSKENLHLSAELMEVKVTLVYNELCVKENVFCSEGEKGPSEGDSGGPLVCEDGKAYGVVAASKTVGGLMLYKYTKISDSSNWINYIVKRN